MTERTTGDWNDPNGYGPNDPYGYGLYGGDVGGVSPDTGGFASFPPYPSDVGGLAAFPPYPSEVGGFPPPTLPPPPVLPVGHPSGPMSIPPQPSVPPPLPGPRPLPAQVVVPPPVPAPVVLPPQAIPPPVGVPVPVAPPLSVPVPVSPLTGPLPVPVVPVPVPPRRSTGSRRTVSVDNNRCHLYAICQMEAPASFELGADNRLRYDPAPPPALVPQVRQAARLCPMQAIIVREV